MDALPAHAGALIQRIGGTGGAAGLYDDLGALAEIDHAVSALAHEQTAVDGQTVLAALTGIDDVVVRYGDASSSVSWLAVLAFTFTRLPPQRT